MAPAGEFMVQKAGSIDPAKYPDEEFELYSIPAFDNKKPETLMGRDIGSVKQVVVPGDVLLSRIVPHIRRAWVVQQDRGHRLIASGEWIIFRSAQFDPSYLRHFLVGDAFHQKFMQTVAGVGGSLLRARPAHVATIALPMPPLAAQCRIAAILDQSEAIVLKRETAVQKAGELLQCVILNLCGDPASNRKGWPVRTIGELCEVKGGKRLPKGVNRPGIAGDSMV
jgi:type I restriction enzyme, S subunit